VFGLVVYVVCGESLWVVWCVACCVDWFGCLGSVCGC